MGKRIKTAREAAGLTQDKLAVILRTKKSTISAYENDKVDIKSSILLEIAKTLNCSVIYLLEGNLENSIDDRLQNVWKRLPNSEVKRVALAQLEALASLQV